MDARTQSIFEDAFAALGRLDNISLVMGFHPQYLGSFLRTQHYLLQMDGPLSLHYRHYIGIMVGSGLPSDIISAPCLTVVCQAVKHLVVNILFCDPAGGS